jgi:hypothetical protein
MATPTLLYGSETLILNARDKSRIQEMRFLRSDQRGIENI